MTSVARHTDEQFIAAWFESGCSPTATAKLLNMTDRAIYGRANTIRAKGTDLPTLHANSVYNRPAWTYPREYRLNAPGATFMVASDLHVWPTDHQPRPAIQQVFIDLAHRLKPDGIIFAGDVIDGSRISRHGMIRGQAAPKVSDEAAAFASFCADLPAAEHRYLTLGNHDLRIDNYLASNANELSDWSGRLTDRTPDWHPCYSVVINDNTEIRHDWHGGIHAAYNNTMRSGMTFVTGHTHQLSCTAMPDRRGTRWGVECGMLNDPLGPQWEWTHGRPNRWRAGFVVLTYDENGTLMPPELCEWIEGRAVFRGQTLGKPRIRVKATRGQ